MARIDKYDPISGGFRAPLAADRTKTAPGNPLGVGLNALGQVVPGAGNTGVLGALVTTRDMKAGDVVDVMTDGDIVEMANVTAGTVITADNATGVVGVTAEGAGFTRLGHTVEATRLVVRARR